MRAPELTKPEKLAGRVFRAQEQDDLLGSFVTDPPTFQVLPWHKIYRHTCAARNGISTALELREVYLFSPAYYVHGETVVVFEEGATLRLPGVPVPAKRFGFIYKEGKCRGCGSTARSKTGRLVDAYARPPLEGRIAR